MNLGTDCRDDNDEAARWACRPRTARSSHFFKRNWKSILHKNNIFKMCMGQEKLFLQTICL